MSRTFNLWHPRIFVLTKELTLWIYALRIIDCAIHYVSPMLFCLFLQLFSLASLPLPIVRVEELIHHILESLRHKSHRTLGVTDFQSHCLLHVPLALPQSLWMRRRVSLLSNHSSCQNISEIYFQFSKFSRLAEICDIDLAIVAVTKRSPSLGRIDIKCILDSTTVAGSGIMHFDSLSSKCQVARMRGPVKAGWKFQLLSGGLLWYCVYTRWPNVKFDILWTFKKHDVRSILCGLVVSKDNWKYVSTCWVKGLGRWCNRAMQLS